MKKKNGFTLVELLAVIVILAIILVIAVPKITKTIADARMGAFQSTLGMVKKSAETYFLTKQTLGANDPEWSMEAVACTDVAELSADYDTTNCKVFYSSVGKATIYMPAKDSGKFNGCTGVIANDGTMVVEGKNCGTNKTITAITAAIDTTTGNVTSTNLSS